MKWVYDLTSAEPIIKDMPIYDAALIDQGELVMIAATTVFTAGADGGYALITASAGASVGAAQGVNCVGISMEKSTTVGSTGSTTSIAAAHNITTGVVAYGKVIINPFAVYRAELASGGSADTVTGASVPVLAGVAAGFTISSATIEAWGGHFVYFSASAGPNYGSFRRIATAASGGTFLTDVAPTATPTTSDRVILFDIGAGKTPGPINAEATAMGSASLTSHTGTNFRIVETWVDIGSGVQKATNLLLGGSRCNLSGAQRGLTKIYQDLMMKDHAFGVDI